MAIRIDFLYNFYILARMENFSKAAEEISITQSALSQQINQLEKFFDCTLIERSTRDFKLTKQGEILIDYSSKIWNLLTEYEKIIAKLSDDYIEIIKISASSIPGTHILPRYIANFKNKFKNVSFSMQITNTKQSLSDLVNEKVQFAAIGSFLDFEPEIFEYIHLYTEKIVFICADKHDLTRKDRNLKLEDIKNYPFIDREKGSGTRDIIERKFEKYRELNHQLKMTNNEAIISAVSESESISLISNLSAKKAEKAGLIKILHIQDIQPIKRELYLVCKKGVKLEKNTMKFMDFISKYKKK